MKKQTKKKMGAIGKYVGWWIATLVVGFLCWVFLYSYGACDGCEPRVYYLIGLFAGVTGTVCYFMLFSLLTPVAKWIWGKIRKKPKGFLKLIK